MEKVKLSKEEFDAISSTAEGKAIARQVVAETFPYLREGNHDAENN